MGLDFPNPVGLAAGLDKNGAAIDGLARLGFGFIEIGTITPRPQPGNPKPRMFRLPQAQAIINRMGFNNLGLDALIENVKRSRFVRDGGILGINIGKNADTPIERAVDDYLPACAAHTRWPATSRSTFPAPTPRTCASFRVRTNWMPCSARSMPSAAGSMRPVAGACRWR
jgi:dihydroorotate dehydrogenase